MKIIVITSQKFILSLSLLLGIMAFTTSVVAQGEGAAPTIKLPADLESNLYTLAQPTSKGKKTITVTEQGEPTEPIATAVCPPWTEKSREYVWEYSVLTGTPATGESKSTGVDVEVTIDKQATGFSAVLKLKSVWEDASDPKVTSPGVDISSNSVTFTVQEPSSDEEQSLAVDSAARTGTFTMLVKDQGGNPQKTENLEVWENIYNMKLKLLFTKTATVVGGQDLPITAPNEGHLQLDAPNDVLNNVGTFQDVTQVIDPGTVEWLAAAFNDIAPSGGKADEVDVKAPWTHSYEVKSQEDAEIFGPFQPTYTRSASEEYTIFLLVGSWAASIKPNTYDTQSETAD